MDKLGTSRRSWMIKLIDKHLDGSLPKQIKFESDGFNCFMIEYKSIRIQSTGEEYKYYKNSLGEFKNHKELLHFEELKKLLK